MVNQEVLTKVVDKVAQVLLLDNGLFLYPKRVNIMLLPVVEAILDLIMLNLLLMFKVVLLNSGRVLFLHLHLLQRKLKQVLELVVHGNLNNHRIHLVVEPILLVGREHPL